MSKKIVNNKIVELETPVVQEELSNKFSDDLLSKDAIDLAIHDLPHDSSILEWWYVNSHFTTIDGEQFSLFAAFFRAVVEYDNLTKESQYANSLIWGVSNVNTQKYYADSLIDKCTPQIGIRILDSYKGENKGLIRVLKEVYEKGNVPYPDRLCSQDVFVNKQKLELDFDGNRFVKLDNGSYELTLFHPQNDISFQLQFSPEKPVMRHGDNGVVRSISGKDMFYYFIPRCRVEGTLTLAGKPIPVKEASGWYDHEFGKPIQNNAEISFKQDVGWNWLSAQLDNNYEITAYTLFDNRNNGKGCGRWAIVIDPEGNANNYQEFTFEPLNCWTSTRTFNDYPTKWKLHIPGANLSLTIDAAFDAQEVITIISLPSFWEGRVNIVGTLDGQEVNGLGFIERSGFGSMENFDEFVSAVGRETQKSVQGILPLTPTDEQIRKLISQEEHYLEGLDRDQYSRTLIRPLREIIDRGGKAWRSYVGLACVDLVGGDSQKFVNWLALFELMHVGSLIIDDVEDKSNVRRGGSSCHTIYGEALAINAGTAAYFLGQAYQSNFELPDADQLKIYDLYFEVMRAGHAGQAIDIDGFNSWMPEIVESGNGEILEKRILTVHWLKTAFPISALAQMAGILGKGTQEQIDGLKYFFESLGLAFQIMDDVLNLRGFKNELKSTGEDISTAKVTFPIAKAISRLSLEERRILWNTISSRPTDSAIISTVIEKLEICGALDACVQQAYDLVESAWKKFDPLFPDSHVKMRVRAFSLYTLERYY